MSVEFDRESPGSLTQGLLIGKLLIGGLGVLNTSKSLGRHLRRGPAGLRPEAGQSPLSHLIIMLLLSFHYYYYYLLYILYYICIYIVIIILLFLKFRYYVL